MAHIVVIGSSNTDMVVTSGKLPQPGETVMGNEFNIFPGGKGANQAVAAARAGGHVIFISKVGTDDFGDSAVAGYQKDGINTDYIFRDQKLPSGVAVILVDEASGENSIVVAPGSNGSLSSSEVQSASEAIAASDIVLAQLEIPLDAVHAALKTATANGITTILNPAPYQSMSPQLLANIDIITPNETETQLMTGIEIEDQESMRTAAEKLLSLVNKMVVITLGAQGVYYLTKDGHEGLVPAVEVKAVDTTAAGDVFNGYLAVMLAEQRPIEDAISLAVRAASKSVTVAGAQTSIPVIGDVG